MSRLASTLVAVLAAVGVALVPVASSGTHPATYRIAQVTDGDTVVLANGQRVRLVQIDTPVFFRTEC